MRALLPAFLVCGLLISAPALAATGTVGGPAPASLPPQGGFGDDPGMGIQMPPPPPPPPQDPNEKKLPHTALPPPGSEMGINMPPPPPPPGVMNDDRPLGPDGTQGQLQPAPGPAVGSMMSHGGGGGGGHK